MFTRRTSTCSFVLIANILIRAIVGVNRRVVGETSSHAVEAGRGTVPNKSETYFAVVEMELLIEAKHVSVPSIV
jgi:hypothetical protein